MSRKRYARLNDWVMAVVYSPLLLGIAWIDMENAKTIRKNRKRGQDDDDETEEWEELESRPDFASFDWEDKVKNTVSFFLRLSSLSTRPLPLSLPLYIYAPVYLPFPHLHIHL